MRAFKAKSHVTHGVFTGPGELMVMYLFGSGVNATIGLGWLGGLYLQALDQVSEYAGIQVTDISDPRQVRSQNTNTSRASDSSSARARSLSASCHGPLNCAMCYISDSEHAV